MAVDEKKLSDALSYFDAALTLQRSRASHNRTEIAKTPASSEWMTTALVWQREVLAAEVHILEEIVRRLKEAGVR